MKIYTVINKYDGLVVTSDTDITRIKEQLFSDRSVQVYEDGKFLKIIDGKDSNNEEVWK